MQDADNALRRIGMHETDSGDLFSDVMNLNVVLRPEDKDFAISALAIHYCLPQNVQAQRVALFSTAWARYSPSFADQTQSRTQQLLAELVSKTLPTELIEPWTCINCQWLSLQFQRPLHEITGLPMVSTLGALHQRTDLDKLPQPCRTVLVDLVLSRPITERYSVAQVLAALSTSNLQKYLGALVDTKRHPSWSGLGDYVMKAHLPDAWAKALSDAGPNNLDSFVAALALYCNRAVDDYIAFADRLCRSTMDAARSGVDMGNRWNTTCRNTILSLQNQMRQQSTNWTAELRKSGYSAYSQSPDERKVQQREALQAWGIDQLVRWIDGPVTAPRARAAARKVKQPPAPESRPAEDKGKASDTTVNASDMPYLLPTALRDCAKFLLGELSDLSALARELKQESVIDSSLTQTASALEAVACADPSAQRDLESDQNLLSGADEALTNLRTRLMAAKTQAKLDERFEAALAQALRKEALVLGKRQGGVIECALPVAQWASVHQRYHQRLLPLRNTVDMVGSNLVLDQDHALALYVTGSSQSGYAFDISVHLWTRHAGKTSQPSLEKGAYPRMNTDDWFDTYQPCCVLHVRL